MRVVTPEQKASGYLVFDGVVARERKWDVIRKLDDGNFLVRMWPEDEKRENAEASSK